MFVIIKHSYAYIRAIFIHSYHLAAWYGWKVKCKDAFMAVNWPRWNEEHLSSQICTWTFSIYITNTIDSCLDFIMLIWNSNLNVDILTISRICIATTLTQIEQYRVHEKDRVNERIDRMSEREDREKIKLIITYVCIHYFDLRISIVHISRNRVWHIEPYTI